jgi:hypothetical protein
MMINDRSEERTSIWKNRKVVFSTLWVFLVLNFIYADVFNLYFDPKAQSTTADMSSGLVLFFAVMMEVGMLMVVLARVLPRVPNRWTNIGAALLNIFLLVYSLTDGAPTAFYAFFVAVEIIALIFVIWYAVTWPKPLNEDS